MLQGPNPRTIGSHCRYKQTLLYKKYIINNFAEHDIEARSEQLLHQTPDTTQEEKVKLEQLLNKLDTQVTQILLKAEKKFGSDPLKKLIRNNEITQYQHIIRYWITFISRHTHKQNMTSILQGILNLIDPEMRLHIHDFITRPQTGLSKVKQLFQDAKAASALHLKEAERIEYAMLAEADNVSSARVRDNRTRAKYTKKLFAQLRTRFKPQHSGGLSHILIPDTNNTTAASVKLVTNPNEVELCIMDRNITHFGQAHGTSFTMPPLQDFLHYEGVSKHAEHIIRGNNITNIKQGTSQAFNDILTKLNDGQQLHKISTNILQQNFMQGMKKWKESTSTSPSGRHQVLGFSECQ